jgi:hypothetical protein
MKSLGRFIRALQVQDPPNEQHRGESRDLRQRYVDYRDRLLADATSSRRGLRLRVLPIAAIGFGSIAAMFGLVSANVMAVNFTTMNSSAAIYTNYLEAQQAAGFMGPGTSLSGGQVVADLGIKTLNLVGLCLIKQQSTPFPMSLIITAGMPVPDPPADSTDNGGLSSHPFDNTALLGSVSAKLNSSGQVLNSTTDPDVVHAQYGYLNTQLLTAYGYQVSGLDLGITADQVNGSSYAGIGNWPTDAGGTTPTAGDFGIYASQMNLSGAAAGSYGLNLKGSISLPKLSIRVVMGSKSQADCS